MLEESARPLAEVQAVEAALRPWARQRQKKNERAAERSRVGKAAVARVAELEALAERGPLSEEQEAELAGLRPKAQQQRQKKRKGTRSGTRRQWPLLIGLRNWRR
ncbi:hypothetical protein [Saccharopolyspora spinosa]|uniref:hypothetical protein n=1 Tax=Saccharopolyspora spinosa TaxID=60894 RepID=UPI00376F1BBE